MKPVSAAMITDQISTAEQPTGTSAEVTTAHPPQAPPPPPPLSEQRTKAPSTAPTQPPPEAQRRVSDRLANWLLGVEPQDVRFPANISQVAFTANYFAALTSDRRKIYVNKRLPGWYGNCKRRSINFPEKQRPSSIASFEHRDILCVVFRTRIEFHSLDSLTRIGNYETATAEVIAVGSRAGRSPLGALWCCRSALRPTEPPEAAFTVWTDRTEAPQRALLLGPSAVGRPERFLCFYWTSADTILLVSRQEATPPDAQRHRQHRSGRVEVLDQQQPLMFCAYDTSGRRPMQRLCRRSVHSASQFCLSPDGRLLLLSGGSRHQLLEAATLRQLLALPRRPAAALDVEAMALTNNGDLVLLLKSALEIHRIGGGLGQPVRCELAGLLRTGSSRRPSDCRVYAIGDLGALVVCEQPDTGGGGDSGSRYRDAGNDGDKTALLQLLRQQGRSLVALVDLHGNVIMRAQWPRAQVHLVSDDLLVILKRLYTKPFSAAHTCIFDFNCPVARRSYWAETPVTAVSTAAADTAPSFMGAATSMGAATKSWGMPASLAK